MGLNLTIRLSSKQKKFVESARIARFATISASGMPHVVPMCFAFDNGNVVIPIQCETHKMHNLVENDRVSLAIDEYSEDWSKLRGVVMQGKAEITKGGEVFLGLRDLIYRKYPQFEKLFPIEEGKYWMIKVRLTRFASWGLK